MKINIDGIFYLLFVFALFVACCYFFGLFGVFSLIALVAIPVDETCGGTYNPKTGEIYE
jgi:hypothetical protein